jgi:hypothetical protein
VNRPWASGLARLLTETHLKKGDLAEWAGVRAGTISAVANSPKAPDIATLQRLADGFTKAVQRKNPQAMPIELWQFFVNDEQAALLVQSRSQQRQLVSEDEMLDRVMARLAPVVTTVLQEELAGRHSADVHAAPRKKRSA